MPASAKFVLPALLALAASQAHAQTTVTIDPTAVGPAISSQILGANMGVWLDVTRPGLATALKNAGVTATRWPGGVNGDLYHRTTHSNCAGYYVDPKATFDTFYNAIVKPAGLALAVTLNYGSNVTCSGGGDPAEAASWVAYAKSQGQKVSHWTLGNEVYGGWEYDLHAVKNDAATYANAMTTGYYPAIKAADPTAQVGAIVVGCGPTEPYCPNTAWDQIVLNQAPYDFVELHWYGQGSGYENDAWMLHQAPINLRGDLAQLKAQLTAAGRPDTPIMIGEFGSVNTNPGKQSTSITQALFAGEVLGEFLNAGVARATWWTAFGSCTDATGGANFSSSLYGWQTFGGYMLISDGTPEYGCPNAPKLPLGTLLPTAQTFKLMSLVALDGEHMLGSSIAGSSELRAYAMTNKGGRAVVLINLNQSSSLKVRVAVNGVSTSTGVTVSSYDKATYDKSRSNVWAGTTTLALGGQRLPLSLTLAPWSINVVQMQ